MAQLFSMPKAAWFDSLGVPLAGGKLYFYTTLTSNLLATYSNDGLSVANANPVVADSTGVWGPIFLQAADYKVVLKTSADVQIWSQDPVHGTGLSDTLRADLASTSSVSLGDALIGVKRNAAGSVATTLHAWIEAQAINLTNDFGSTGDQTAIAAAIAYAKTSELGIEFPHQVSYTMTDVVQFNAGKTPFIRFNNAMITMTSGTAKPAFWIGNATINSTPHPDYPGTVFNLGTGAIALNAVTYTCASTAGIAAGDTVHMFLGQGSVDAGQHKINFFTTVVSFIANTSITVQTPCPEAIGAGFAATYAFSPAYHRMVKYTSAMEGIEVSGFRFKHSGTFAPDKELYFVRMRNIHLHHAIVDSYSGIQVYSCENMLAEHFDYERCQAISGSSGGGITFAGCRNSAARNFRIGALDGSAVYIENDCRGITIEDFEINIAASATTASTLFVDGQSKGVNFNRIRINQGAALSGKRTLNVGAGSEVYCTDFDLSDNITEFPLQYLTRGLKWKGYRIDKPVTYKRAYLFSSGTTATYEIPDGFYKSIKVLVPAGIKVHLDLITVSTASTGPFVIKDDGAAYDHIPAEGTLAELTGWNGVNGNDGYRLIGATYTFNSVPTGKTISFTCAAGMPANTEVVFYFEVFPLPDDGVNGLLSTDYPVIDGAGVTCTYSNVTGKTTITVP